MRSMRQSWPWMVFVLATLMAHPGQGENAAASDLADLEGRWTIVSLMANGMPVDFEGEDTTIVIKGRKMTFPEHKKMQRKADTAWILVDPTTTPKSVDFLPEAVNPDLPRPKGSFALGIYEVEGESLKMCWALAGDRPAAIESTPNTLMLVAKRIEKQAADGSGKNPPPVPPKP